MPSDRETNSATWRLASTVEWDVIRAAAGFGERMGRVGESEHLMADVAAALADIKARHALVSDFMTARRARPQARKRGIPRAGGTR